jgi:hypothetical protein
MNLAEQLREASVYQSGNVVDGALLDRAAVAIEAMIAWLADYDEGRELDDIHAADFRRLIGGENV